MADDYTPDDDFDDLKATPDLTPHSPGNNLEGIDTEEIEIENGSSKLASTPGKNILLLVLMGIGAVIFLYQMVFKEDQATQDKKEIAKVIESQPVEEAIKPTKEGDKLPLDVGIVETPELPKIEGLQPPPPPTSLEEPTAALPEETFGGFAPVTPTPVQATPQPIKVVEPTAQPLITPPPVVQPMATVPVDPATLGPSAEEIAARKASRRKSAMMVVNGGGAPEAGAGVDGSPVKLGKTTTTQVTATAIGNTDLMIAQGKMLDAVLETAINSDLPGLLRAVISRDIYAETGKNILIPKGSRLVGEYSNAITQGQERVMVTWNRVIRPDGVDIAITSPGTDQLGHSGVAGFVDNKYLEIIGQSILLSAITVGGTMVADSINPSSGTTSSTTTAVNGDSTSSQSGTPTDFAVLNSVKNVNDVASKIAEGLLNDKPTIIVQQGTLIKVFVNKDLIFPEDIAGNIKVIN
jgi:type IV secretion system protein VirB10